MAGMSAGIVLVAGLAALNGAGRPVSLDVQHEGEMLILKVIGKSAENVEAKYRLVVTSESASGRNTTNQAGQGRIISGQSTILTTVVLSNRPGTAMRATLQVEPANSAAYTIEEVVAAS